VGARVFLAGGSGALGRPLTSQLVAAGHDVTALARSDESASRLGSAGARVARGDVRDLDRLRAIVAAASPEVVIDHVTNLPSRWPLVFARSYPRNTEMRRLAGANLLDAARSAGARRLISESAAFMYAPDGDGLRREGDPIWTHAPEPLGSANTVFSEHDDRVVAAGDIEGVVLRYGTLYGPGTWFERGGSIWTAVRRGVYPVPGDGGGMFSFAHVEDTATACVAAVERGAGIYNVVDDDSVPLRDWVPIYAEAAGARPPRSVPVWLARLMTGKAVVAWGTVRPGASNERARAELGWEPRYRSWREGFREGLG
jgi:nucleoside-diphosphate-sugar epimerase